MLLSIYDVRKQLLFFSVHARYYSCMQQLYYAVSQQEPQLPLRNRASAMYFFVAKLLFIAVTPITCETYTFDDPANLLRT